MHKDESLIQAELADAAKKVKVGGLYSHYKDSSKLYKVLNLAVMENNGDLCVVYEAQYGPKLVFVRPLNSWLENVDWEGEQKDRFSLSED